MNSSNSRNGGRFNDRGNNNARFNRNNNNNNGSKDRGRRFDYVDPWAHNGGGSNGNASSSFVGNGSMPSLTSLMGQNGGGFGNNNNNLQQQDMDGKSSTQVTIPKDVINF